MTDEEKQKLLLDYISYLFTEIRGDWSDPRSDCRAGWEAVSHLRKLLGYEGEDYRSSWGTDEQYYKYILEEMNHDQRGA